MLNLTKKINHFQFNCKKKNIENGMFNVGNEKYLELFAFYHQN
jgi:hypothetical protein